LIERCSLERASNSPTANNVPRGRRTPRQGELANFFQFPDEFRDLAVGMVWGGVKLARTDIKMISALHHFERRALPLLSDFSRTTRSTALQFRSNSFDHRVTCVG
jgi:hypothetical protein